ncbi:MAG: SGNH/GDSL hydrolase family protein, partial [Cyanobacteria bacterium P01_D01_bin.73]
MKGVWIAIALVLGVAIAVELGLRWVLGLGTPPLYVGDEKTGYRLKPHQKIRRFGNRIEVNQFSMRGSELAESGTTLRVLVLGDSIVNGGWWTDQEDTLTERLRLRLSKGLPPRVFEALVSDAEAKQAAGRSRPLEVLNVSANSWGPRNELGYIEQFGVFDAQALVLVINTDDFFSKPPTSIPVG